MRPLDCSGREAGTQGGPAGARLSSRAVPCFAPQVGIAEDAYVALEAAAKAQGKSVDALATQAVRAFLKQ